MRNKLRKRKNSLARK